MLRGQKPRDSLDSTRPCAACLAECWLSLCTVTTSIAKTQIRTHKQTHAHTGALWQASAHTFPSYPTPHTSPATRSFPLARSLHHSQIAPNPTPTHPPHQSERSDTTFYTQLTSQDLKTTSQDHITRFRIGWTTHRKRLWTSLQHYL